MCQAPGLQAWSLHASGFEKNTDYTGTQIKFRSGRNIVVISSSFFNSN